MLKLKINSKQYINAKTSNQGFSALAMVLIFLFLGMLLVNSLNQSSLAWQKSFIHYKLFYQHFNTASSSIAWSISQSWRQPTADWQCQSLPTYQLNACIKQSTLSTGNYVIIKGQSGQISLYYLATFKAGKLNVQRGHWLDYCPENRSLDCD